MTVDRGKGASDQMGKGVIWGPGVLINPSIVAHAHTHTHTVCVLLLLHRELLPNRMEHTLSLVLKETGENA